MRTVLDMLRARIDPERFDAVILELETVAADLGYGDVRALPGTIAWIDHLRGTGKRIALVDTGERGPDATRIAGIADRFEAVASTLIGAVDALDLEPGRIVAVDASAEGIADARQAGAYLAIALARGSAGPEQLRRAGADAVVADLSELL